MYGTAHGFDFLKQRAIPHKSHRQVGLARGLRKLAHAFFRSHSANEHELRISRNLDGILLGDINGRPHDKAPVLPRKEGGYNLFGEG